MPEENGEKCVSHSKESAHHSHHFDVAHAHAFPFAHQFVERRSSEKQQAPEGRAEESVQNIEKSVEMNSCRWVGVKIAEVERTLKPEEQRHAGGIVRRYACCKGQADAEAGPVDGVGQNAYAQVGDDQNDQKATEDQELEGGKGQAEIVVGEDEECARQKLDDGIHRRNRQAAITAFAAQPDPAKNRNIVVGLNRIQAAGTTRTGRNNGKALRNAGDTDIQEAADAKCRTGRRKRESQH